MQLSCFIFLLKLGENVTKLDENGLTYGQKYVFAETMNIWEPALKYEAWHSNIIAETIAEKIFWTK